MNLQPNINLINRMSVMSLPYFKDERVAYIFFRFLVPSKDI